MFKKKNESVHHEARVRVVTTEFSGLGINGHEGDTFVIAANVPAPPCLLLNTEAYDGPAPFNAIRYDEAAHASYTRANMPRVEPKPALTMMRTAAEVCADLGWSEADLRVACASGFPKPSGWRDVPGRRGLQCRYRTALATRSRGAVHRALKSVACRRTLTSFKGWRLAAAAGSAGGRQAVRRSRPVEAHPGAS